MPAVLWLDLELELTDSEYDELIGLKELIDSYSSMVIPHSVLPRKKIDLKRSALIKKLISYGYCTLGLSEIEIRKKIVESEDFPVFREYIEERYLNILSLAGSDLPPFPSSIFTKFSEEPLEIFCDDLSSYNPKRLGLEEGFIRIHFGKQNLPDVLLTGSVIPKLKDICIKKIREHFVVLSGMAPDFYSDKIQKYKRYFKGRNLELIEMEIGKIQAVTEKQSREAVTRIVINRINEVDDALEMFLSDIGSSENNYVLTNYAMDNRRDFDFFQALSLLQRGVLSQRQHHSVNNNTLLQAVRQSISGFVTVSELKKQALKTHSELREEEYDAIYQSFEEQYIGLGAKLPSPLILKQNIPKETKTDQYLVHVSNLNSFLESRIIKAADEILDMVKSDWKSKLNKHMFDEGMFSDSIFRKQLSRLLEKNFFTLYCFLRNHQLSAFLDMAGLLSPRVNTVREYGIDKLDLCLKIDRQELYETIHLSILTPLSQFSKLVFRLLHWIYRSIYMRKPVKERVRDSIPPAKLDEKTIVMDTGPEPAHRLLQFCECTSEQCLIEKLDRLWGRIPDQNIQRDDVEQNILRDLNSFFTDKEIIYFESLEFLIETNINRILSRGQHLVPYSETLKDFIVCHMCYTIYVDTYMRKKIRFKKFAL